MAFAGFGKNSGPTAPPRAQTPFGNFPSFPSPAFSTPPRELESSELMHTPPMTFSGGRPAATPFHSLAEVASEVRPIQGNRKSFPFPENSAKSHQGSPVVSPFVSGNPGSVHATSIAQVQDVKWMRSPTSLSSSENLPRNFQSSGENYADLQYNGQRRNQQARSPPSLFPKILSADGKDLSSGHSKRPASFPQLVGSPPQPFSNFNKLQSEPPVPSNSTSVGPYDSERRSPITYDDVQVLKRTRSPTFSPSAENSPVKSTYPPAGFRRYGPK
ncbi:hypothetical protein Leryth_001873 [Lithospermum erythrorhizon]|nr:hypothetical protein Leryth_001873 [Lithospermum erythrorhizon]